MRDCAPWLGRWTTKDPIGQAGGLNVYGYAGNDPINFIDPSGHSAIMCALLRELLGQVPGMQLAMALMDPNSTAWDIAAAIATELPWNRALRAARGLKNVLGAVSGSPAYASAAASALTGRSTVRIRHYTNNSGLNGIESGGVIRASDQNKVFAESARGRPLSPRDAEAAYGLKKGRGRNYVETDVPSDRVSRVYNPLTKSNELQMVGDVLLQNATITRR